LWISLVALVALAAAPSPAPTPAPTPVSADGDVERGPEDLPEGDCFSPGKAESRLVVPVTKIERFSAPVLDAHSHAYAETAEQVAAWVALMDRVGIRQSLILTGETGEKFRELSARYAGAHPGRFLMAAGMEQKNVEAADYGERLRRAVRAD